MALTSVYYDGPVTETDRAKNLAGAPEYGVYGPEDFKVTAHPSIPYAVLVKAGRAHGHGVTDTAMVDQVVQCATLATGTRWDLVVVRRNWQPALGGPSTLEVLQAGATAVIPAGRKIGPGVEDDQPLFLVKWQGGTSAPVEFIDLRILAGNGGLFAKSDLVRTYLTTVGTGVNINGIVWALQLGGNDVAEWVQSPAARVDGIPAGVMPILKTGNVALNTTIYGDAYYSFPSPFPSAMVSCVAVDATDPAQWPAMIVKFAAVYSDRTRFCFRVYDHAGNVLASKTNLNISYIATGY
jgi:hypothetical protein